MKRDLHADLRICEAATPGPWHVDKGEGWSENYPRNTYIQAQWNEPNERGCVGYRVAKMAGVHDLTMNDARFIAEAREGWPHAIRRALEAEERIKELEVELEQVKKDRDGWHEAFKKACVLEHRAVKARNALKEELDELRKIVSSECPVGALDIVNSLRVEKAHMQERIAELEAEIERLKAQIEEMKDEIAAWKKIALGFDKFREGEE